MAVASHRWKYVFGSTLALWALCISPAFAQQDVGGEAQASANPVAAIRKLTVGGHADLALQQAEALQGSSPHLPGLDLAEGDALYSLNRLPEADQAYARAMAADPHDQAAAQMRGLTLFKLGRPKEALPLLETNHANGVQSKADPSYVLALCYMDTLRYDDARRAFAVQFGVPPDSATAYLLAARMLLRREFKPVAKQFAEKALSLEPALPGAHLLLGEMELSENHLPEAIGLFQQERQHNPLLGVSYERLGDALTRSGKYPEAEQILQQAVLLEPNATGPYILLGKVLLKENQPVGATTFLQKAEAMDPANYMTHNLLAQAYRSLGRAAEASRELALTEKIQAADQPKLSTPK